MVRLDLPESETVLSSLTVKNEDGQLANQILNALIVQTSQVEYDEVTVEKLINEYERLMS